MKNKWFYPGLFGDSMRRLRVVGFSSLVILEIGAIFFGVMLLMNGLSEESTLAYYGASNSLTQTLLGGLNIIPLTLAVPLLVAPIMVLYLFRYLNHRNEADFYHALPCRRQALFLSQLAAVVVWVTGILLINAATSIVFVLLMSKWYAINIVSVLTLLFNVWATTMLIVGGVALAMSLTGTMLTNIIASFLVLFFPRVLITYVSVFLGYLLPTITPNHLFGVFDPPYNLLTNTIVSVFFGDTPSLLNFIGGGIYTLCVGIVYMALALWAFHRRHSERAGHAAGNRVMQTVFRLSFTMLVCLIPCGIILYNRNHLDRYEMFGIVLTYVLALIAYFLYELITTKKLRNLVRSLPALGVLLVLNVALVGGISVARNAMLARDIQPSEVRSVSINGDPYNYTSMYSSDEDDYYQSREQELVYEDEKIIKLLADAFTEDNKLLRQSETKYEELGKYNQKHLVQFRMKNGTDVYRYVYLDSQEVEMLAELKMKHPELKKLYMELPKLSRWDSCGFGNIISIEARHELYEIFRQELLTQDFSLWYEAMNDRDSEINRLPFHVSVTYSVGTENKDLNVRLPETFTKTFARYVEMLNEEGENDFDKIVTIFKKEATAFASQTIPNKDGQLSHLNLYIEPVLAKGIGGETSINYMEDSENPTYRLDAIFAMFDKMKENKADASGAMYFISLDGFNGEDYYNYEAFVPMPGGIPDPLLTSGEYVSVSAGEENAKPSITTSTESTTTATTSTTSSTTATAA